MDPPPIVELQIFEGDGQETDITYGMHASYFLFATLEQARPMAQGRVPADRNTHPVLTGTPVAGMVYLDRPKPAGYFIFPDLSVRHEGRYRLSFSLYEELKNHKDEDKHAEDAKPDVSEEPHVTHRLEVKSVPFHVYSAKKFPGLTESTSLSRMVAEQGCRVRIRRDVRMRRRETKGGGKEWDDYEDDTAAVRARMSSTPDPNMYAMQTPHSYADPIPRPRSTSNASHQSLGNTSRRPSVQDMHQAYQQPPYGTAPHTPQNGYAQSTPYGPSPTQAYQPSPFAQPSSMQPPHQYGQGYPPPPPPQNQNAAPQQQNYYGYAPAQQAPVQPAQYGAPPPPPPSYESTPQQQRSSVDYSSHSDYRRQSTQQQALPPPPPPPSYLQQSSQSYQHQAGNSQQQYQPPPPPAPQQSNHSYSSSVEMYPNRPAPLEPMLPPARTTGATTPLNGRQNFDLPPLQTAMLSSGKLEACSPSPAAPQSSYFLTQQTPSDNHKRSYGNVFSDRHQSQPLRQGARPAPGNDYGLAPSLSVSAADEDDSTGELDPSTLSMHYRRADGRQILRALPGHQQ